MIRLKARRRGAILYCQDDSLSEALCLLIPLQSADVVKQRHWLLLLVVVDVSGLTVNRCGLLYVAVAARYRHGSTLCVYYSIIRHPGPSLGGAPVHYGTVQGLRAPKGPRTPAADCSLLCINACSMYWHLDALNYKFSLFISVRQLFVILVTLYYWLWSPALSIARARLPLYFTAVYLFLLSPHFLRRRKTDIPKLSHTTWLSIQQNLCYSDFFKVPPKTNGGRKTQNLHHFSCQVADN